MCGEHLLKTISDYTGDMILVDRLSGFFTEEHWSWNDGESVWLDDISRALHENQAEEATPFGDAAKYPCMEYGESVDPDLFESTKEFQDIFVKKYGMSDYLYWHP